MICASSSAFRHHPPPPLSVSIQGQGGTPPPNLAVHANSPLLSFLPPQWVDPPLQPSAVNPPHLPQILAFPLQQDMPPLQPLYTCVTPPPLSPSRFKDDTNPLFYLQPCALMFLCFLPCFFGKACLFLSPHWAWSSSSAFSLDSSTSCAYSSASIRAYSSFSSALYIASRDRRTPTSTLSRASLCSSAIVMGSDVCVSWNALFYDTRKLTQSQ